MGLNKEEFLADERTTAIANKSAANGFLVVSALLLLYLIWRYAHSGEFDGLIAAILSMGLIINIISSMYYTRGGRF